MAERKRKYQDVYDLLKQNPELSKLQKQKTAWVDERELNKRTRQNWSKTQTSDAARDLKVLEYTKAGDVPRSKPPIVSGMDRHHKRHYAVQTKFEGRLRLTKTFGFIKAMQLRGYGFR